VAASTAKILDQVDLAQTATNSAGCCIKAGSALPTSLDRESQSVRSAWDLKDGLADLAVSRDSEGRLAARGPRRAWR